MIHWDFKKITTAILTTLGIGTLTSCYGMPGPDYGSSYSGYVYGDTKYEKPIKGIKVTITQDGKTVDETYTDSYGFFEFYKDGDARLTQPYYEYEKYGTVTFTDVDGSANGGSFKTLSKEMYFPYSGTNNEMIILEKE